MLLARRKNVKIPEASDIQVIYYRRDIIPTTLVTMIVITFFLHRNYKLCSNYLTDNWCISTSYREYLKIPEAFDIPVIYYRRDIIPSTLVTMVVWLIRPLVHAHSSNCLTSKTWSSLVLVSWCVRFSSSSCGTDRNFVLFSVRKTALEYSQASFRQQAFIFSCRALQIYLLICLCIGHHQRGIS